MPPMQDPTHPPQVALRPPSQVMRLDRMGAAFPTRLSFLRALLRNLIRDGWRFERPLWRIDDAGVGRAIYRAIGPQRTYCLVCFSQELPPEQRTDRVIAEAWDASFVLYDGDPSPGEIERLAINVPKQEAGRFQPRDLVLSRANRSVRLFEKVAAALAHGRQPDGEDIAAIGYLMRTTAVYGNGKFGIADRDVIAARSEFAGPFRAEMLTVWLIRAFTVDLVEHIARARAPETAVPLEPRLRRRFGVGNATGLGMAPFLVRHPALVHRWFLARETALARVRAVAAAGLEQQGLFARAIGRAKDALMEWRTGDAIEAARLVRLRNDLARIGAEVENGAMVRPAPWDMLYRFAERELSLEGQELTAALLMEPHGPLIDDLADSMSADEDAEFTIDGSMTGQALRDLIHTHYGWALTNDYGRPEQQARFWYSSAEKLEPRLGERWHEPGGEREQPLGVARDVAALALELARGPAGETVAALLAAAPEHRHSVRRIQATARAPYAEIRDNLLSATMRPIDILRCKLAFFGATRFDPRSDRWLRITLCQGAPFPAELAATPADDWTYSSLMDRK